MPWYQSPKGFPFSPCVQGFPQSENSKKPSIGSFCTHRASLLWTLQWPEVNMIYMTALPHLWHAHGLLGVWTWVCDEVWSLSEISPTRFMFYSASLSCGLFDQQLEWPPEERPSWKIYSFPEGWAMKNWCFRTVVLMKTFESSLEQTSQS